MKIKKFEIKRLLLLGVLVLTLTVSLGALINTSNKTKPVQAADIVAYNQNNNTWSSLYYGGRTIGVTGCGILSLTNGINYYRPMSYSDVHTCVTDFASHAYSTGDFNGTASSSVYSTVLEHGFSDARLIAERTTDHWTFNHGYADPARFGEPSAILDFCFVSQNRFRVLSYRVPTEKYLGMYPSDHFPVIVEMTMFNG